MSRDRISPERHIGGDATISLDIVGLVRLCIGRVRKHSVETSNELVGGEPDIIKLARLYFEAAIAGEENLTDPKNYLQKGHPDCGEYIALVKEGKTMYLCREEPDRLYAQNSFPYWLQESVDAFELDTGVPRTIERQYYLDPSGNFHHRAVVYGDVLVSVADEETQARLMGFVREAHVAPMIPIAR